MALSCSAISANVAANYCTINLTSGLRETVYIWNTDDVDLTAGTGTTTASDGSLTTLVMKSSKNIYTIDQPPQYPQVNELTQDEETVVPTYRPQITLTLPVNAANTQLIKDLGVGSYAIGVEPKGSKDEAPMYVYGFDSPLRATNVTITPSDKATGSLYIVTMAQDENDSGDTYPQRIWVDTDYATTISQRDALVAS